MLNRWSDADAHACGDPLSERAYTSRLLGVDPELVMHGGGNTSVKLAGDDIFGRPVDVLHVKGSGSDLATDVGRRFRSGPARPPHGTGGARRS